ncbi:hypothetical protein [Vitreimonas flagellata]|uniref:hypothetical protein n=1 Tax=Vitreimonas flagellata TaxID=2560861 RepID=UPI0010750065|nr:hypothetical protein [Vitreimonas flagellata]
MQAPDALTAELDAWSAEQGLPNFGEYDLLDLDDLTSDQRDWLKAFVARREAAEALADQEAGPLAIGLSNVLSGASVRRVERAGQYGVSLVLEGDVIQSVTLRAEGDRLVVELDGQPLELSDRAYNPVRKVG